MNVLSLDIELNQFDGQPKVIEIGALVIKSRTGEVIDTFHTYVDPKELITEFITNLTTIKDSDILGAPSINEAYFLLKEFHKKHKCTRNPILWGSGTRNDSNTIWQESKVEEPNFMGHRVIDAKTLYQSYQMHTNGTIRAGLETACQELGIDWASDYGKPHQALADAYNTTRVWFYLISRMRLGFKL